MASPLTSLNFQAIGADGLAVPGGLLYSYVAGTLTPQATYTDSTGSVANANPVVLDAAGQKPVWLGDSAYRFILKTAAGVTVRDVDNVRSAGGLDAQLRADLSSTAAGGQIGFSRSLPYAADTVGAKLQEIVSAKDDPFNAAGNGTTNDTTAIAAAEAAANDIYLPPGTYLVNGSHAFTKRFNGPGSFSYSGIGTISFTGSGTNNLSASGTMDGPRAVTVIVEIVSVTPTPETWRWSSDGGTTWISTNTTIDAFDVETTVPLAVTTSPWPLGHTGVSVTFGSTTGHAVGARWTFTLRPNPHVLNAQTALYLRGQLFAHTDGRRSMSIGTGNLSSGFQVGFENVAVGIDCLQNVVSTYGNTAVGVRALQKVKTGFLNTGVGVWALRDNVAGQQNTAVGVYCASGVKGSTNTAIGVDALSWIDQAQENTAVGVQALHGNDTTRVGTALRNVAVGVQALRAAEGASYNTAVGAFAASVCVAGTGNAAVGYSALNQVLGNSNSAVGLNAGAVVTNASGNVFIGAGAGNPVGQKLDAQNTVAIGKDTFTTADNQIAIGNSAHTNVFVYGHLKPQTDNLQDLGSATARMRVIYAGTGAINTSDERSKQDIGGIPDEWLDAWAEVEWVRYRMRDAVQAKGDGARWHVGLIAQRVRDAFAARGIDAFAIGLLCYDKWDATQSGHRDIPAGDLYGIRYEEAQAMESAWLRRELARLRRLRDD